jgi:gliding motility-associated-like protein
LIIPTLITPNGDSWNEYFVLNGLETLGKTDLIIFDRKGREVFRNVDYDNKWNGVDYNGNPLPDDTYFYILKSANGKSLSGYIMIRK